MFNTSIITDLLQSVQRLNEELDSRVRFEHTLITIIGSKDDEINRLQDELEDVRRECNSLTAEFKRADLETKKFVEFASRYILKDGEQFVKNIDGDFEIYPERPIRKEENDA